MFSFDDSYYLGDVREVDTRKISIIVEDSQNLKKARVNQLIVAKLNVAYDYWLVGMIEKVIKSIVLSSASIKEDEEEPEYLGETVLNTVKVTLIGALKWDATKQRNIFTKSVDQVPEIDTQCFILKDRNLEFLMGVLAEAKDSENLLEVGIYKLDDKAKALIDGNKLFQRHAAILGSTGSGKSWMVATLLENTAKLASSNVIVFDLHGEYKNLAYAKQLRIPSQCNNIIALRLTNSDDQNAVKSVLPESYASLLEQLPLLDVGEAMAVGDAVLLPSRIKINEPTQKPLSATIDFWSEWTRVVNDIDFEKTIDNLRRQSRT